METIKIKSKLINIVFTTILLIGFTGCEKQQVFKDDDLQDLQLTNVKKNWHSLKYISNPSLKVQLAAIKENPNAIRYIKNPSQIVQM
jgi:uncharacterized lipoprotein YehR (DUF1307 family)